MLCAVHIIFILFGFFSLFHNVPMDLGNWRKNGQTVQNNHTKLHKIDLFRHQPRASGPTEGIQVQNASIKGCSGYYSTYFLGFDDLLCSTRMETWFFTSKPRLESHPVNKQTENELKVLHRRKFIGMDTPSSVIAWHDTFYWLFAFRRSRDQRIDAESKQCPFELLQICLNTEN